MTGPSPRGGGRIVVGVTGSLASLAALRHAAALARREGAPLLAVLVWEPPREKDSSPGRPTGPGRACGARTPGDAWRTRSSTGSAASPRASPSRAG